MWENRSHSIVTPPCLTKHCLTLLDNSLHLPDQALNGFLWFVKVTHLERRKICCYWEHQESVLQVRKVTQKGSYQNVLCFSSAIGIHSDSLPEWLLGNETAPTLCLSAGRVFLKLGTYFKFIFGMQQVVYQVMSFRRLLIQQTFISHHLPDAVGSGDSEWWIVVMQFSGQVHHLMDQKIKELVLNFAKNPRSQGNCARRTNSKIWAPGS